MIGAGSSETVYDVAVVGASFASWPAETRFIRMAVGQHRSDCGCRG